MALRATLQCSPGAQSVRQHKVFSARSARRRKAWGASPRSIPAGDHDGEIDLSWDTVSGAKSYIIEQSGDPVTPTTWTHKGVSTKSSYTASGLTSGTRYWFRVAAVNNNGQSGWSDPAMKIAP